MSDTNLNMKNKKLALKNTFVSEKEDMQHKSTLLFSLPQLQLSSFARAMKVSIIAVTAVAALLLGFLFASTPVSSAADASPPPATNVALPIQEASALFTDWMQTYQIVFPDQEELEYRFSVFKENIEYIIAHNLRNDSTITLGAFGLVHRSFPFST
jgi:hypothetical protein